VKLQYRCSLCGTEVRMTVATEEAPDPPRHCMDDMELQQTEDL
jgi:DNA-directed RNA polymerase subunit RPC12/RpoP